MSKHVVMEPFTTTWWLCITAVLSVIALLISLPYFFSWARHKNYPKCLAFLLLLNLVIENLYTYSTNNWSIQYNLPLHMCGMSGVMSMLLLFNFNSRLAHLVYYWGLTGGIYSLLTPEFDLGNDGFLFYSYFISHGGLLLTCLYMIVHHKFKPENNSWFTIFMFTQLAVVVVGSFNWATGANYMYLIHPPAVDNPLIVGDWPWYILVFEVLAIIHFYLFYRVSKVWK